MEYQLGFNPKNVDVIPATNIIGKAVDASHQSYVYSVLAKTNAMQEEELQTAIDFVVTNHANMVATGSLPVSVEAPLVTMVPTRGLLVTNELYTVTNRMMCSLSLTLPIYESKGGSDGWDLSLETKELAAGWIVIPGAIFLTNTPSGVPALTAELLIDPSKVPQTNGPSKFSVRFRHNGDIISASGISLEPSK